MAPVDQAGGGGVPKKSRLKRPRSVVFHRRCVGAAQKGVRILYKEAPGPGGQLQRTMSVCRTGNDI